VWWRWHLLPCYPWHLVARICCHICVASAPAGKAEHSLCHTCVARACWWVAFGLPGTRVTFLVVTRPALSWCVGTLLRDIVRFIVAAFWRQSLLRVQPGNRARCHTTELRPPAARRRRDHASICMPLVRPILREIVDRYCASTLAVFQCRLCCCYRFGFGPMTVSRCSRHRSRDGGNTSALPSIDWVGRGLAGRWLSSSRVIPERPKSFLHCTTPSALIGGLGKPRRQPAVLTCVVIGAHVNAVLVAGTYRSGRHAALIGQPSDF